MVESGFDGPVRVPVGLGGRELQAAPGAVPDEPRPQQPLDRAEQAVVRDHPRQHLSNLHDVRDALVLACGRPAAAVLLPQNVALPVDGVDLLGGERVSENEEPEIVEVRLLL